MKLSRDYQELMRVFHRFVGRGILRESIIEIIRDNRARLEFEYEQHLPTCDYCNYDGDCMLCFVGIGMKDEVQPELHSCNCVRGMGFAAIRQFTGPDGLASVKTKKAE